MTEDFPLQPDPDWYERIVERFGDAVPPIKHLRIRRGIQSAVGEMFGELEQRGLLPVVDIFGIETRTAAWAIVDARYHRNVTEGDRKALDAVLEGAQERLTTACEHCGRRGEIVAKTGLEALLDDPDAFLGDRFICVECYEKWRAA
jgi:hypothetical protein